MIADPVTGLGLAAALSEGSRPVAHLVILLAVPVAAGLVYLIRRARRRDRARKRQGNPE